MTDAYDLYDARERQYEEPAQYDCESCEDTGFQHGLVGSMDFLGCPSCGLSAYRKDVDGSITWVAVPSRYVRNHHAIRILQLDVRRAA